MLLKIENREAKLRKVELTKAVDDGKTEAKLFFQLDLLEEEVKGIDGFGEGFAAIHKALAAKAASLSDKQEDEPNSVSLNVRAGSEVERYTLRSGKSEVVMDGEVQGVPKIGMVDNGMTMFWKVGGLVAGADAAKLAKWVSSGVTLTVASLQGNLFQTIEGGKAATA